MPKCSNLDFSVASLQSQSWIFLSAHKVCRINGMTLAVWSALVLVYTKTLLMLHKVWSDGLSRAMFLPSRVTLVDLYQAQVQ